MEPQDRRRGDWMQTFSGVQFWPLDPRKSEVSIYDIAHALGNICRYNGHSKFYYSVAEHSVLVSRALPRKLALWGLLHDASEAYLSDVPRPLKPHLNGYKELELKMMFVIAEHFGLKWPEPPGVKKVDFAILVDEMEQVMTTPPTAWDLPIPALGVEIKGWLPDVASDQFIVAYYNILRYKGNSNAVF